MDCFISMDASHVNANVLLGKKLVHAKDVQILPGCYDLTPTQIQCSLKFARISGRKSRNVWKSALPLQVPDEKTSTEDELHFACALWDWFIGCESFL